MFQYFRRFTLLLVAMCLVATWSVSLTAQTVEEFLTRAEAGDAEAQFNLGLMYAYGRGVPQNYVTAYMWLTLAMSRPDLEDSDLEIVVQTRDQVAAQLTPDELAEGQRLASAWDAAHPRD